MRGFISFISVTAIALVCGLMAAPASSAAEKSGKLNDSQIAHIAYTAGDLDIKAAQQALRRSKNPQVRAFAQGMIRDHKAVNDKLLALAKKLNITGEDNATSQGLVKQAGAKRGEFSKLNGPAFDKAYVANEVAYHHAVNSSLQKTLIPSAHNKEVKELLSTGLKIFQGHEAHAKQIAAGMK